jgi:uncharacterized repeat protein (TIGR01451 family)
MQQALPKRWARLLWPLALGLGLGLALFLALTPHHHALAQEVDWVDLEVGGTHIWGCVPATPITITTAVEQRVIENGDCFDEWLEYAFQAGDTVTVAAGAGTQPVVIAIPDPFSAQADSAADEVSGQIDALDHEWIEVELYDTGTQMVQTDGSGAFSVMFPDIRRADQGDTRYATMISGANVTFHGLFRTMDLIMGVNYGHDWVEGDYGAGHTVWITVTESDGATVKGTAQLQTGPVPWWGGRSGFSTQPEDWVPGPGVDIVPGDWVYGRLDGGYTSTVRVGIINGELDVAADTISGTLNVSWLSGLVPFDCNVWEQDGPGRSFLVNPNGGRYFCDFGLMGWDLLPGHDVGVSYQEPDGDRIFNVFEEPAPYLRIEKWSDDEPGESGNTVFHIQYRNDGGADAEDTAIRDVMEGGLTYLADTSGIAPSGSGTPGDPLIWDLGDVPPGDWIQFDVFAQVTAVASNTVTNTAVIETANPFDQGDPGEKQASWAGHVRENDTHLNVGKSAWTPDPTPGYDFVYAVNVCNNGATGSSEVTLTDTLHPSTTLQTWWGQDPGWVERFSDDHSLVVSRPSISGWRCTEVYLRAALNEGVQAGSYISNTAVIAAENDIETDDNETFWDGWTNTPYANLFLTKDWTAGQFVPGGVLYYSMRYGNDGNVPLQGVSFTATLPADTSLVEIWHYDRNWNPIGQITPTLQTASQVVWSIGDLDNGAQGNLELRLRVDASATPGALLTHKVEIAPDPAEYHYDDNVLVWTDLLNAAGPNLQVHKQNSGWWGIDRLSYEIRVKNLGTERLQPVWITETYPVSTTFNGDLNVNHGPQVTITHDAPNRQIELWLEALDPGETASIDFRADLDGDVIGTQGLAFTNTLAAPVSGDVNPDDNYDQVVDYAGPDVYIEKWLSGGQVGPGETVTFTVKYGNRSSWDGIDGMYGSHVTDTLPTAMAFITSTSPWSPGQPWMPDAEIGDHVVGWDAGTMWPSSAWYFNVVARITDTVQGGEVFTNVVEAYSANPADVDWSLDNNLYKLPLSVPIEGWFVYLPLVIK